MNGAVNSKIKHLVVMCIGELKAAFGLFFQDECKMIKVVERKENFW